MLQIIAKNVAKTLIFIRFFLAPSVTGYTLNENFTAGGDLQVVPALT